MSTAARTRLVRLFVRVAISAATLGVFALHVAGAPRIEIIERVENYFYDVRIRLTMPGTVDERYRPGEFARLLAAILPARLP